MAGINLSKTELRSRDNGTESKLPTGVLAEAIELLEQARGVLGCVERLGEPERNVETLLTLENVQQMASAAGAAANLVVRAQEFLIEADVIEEMSHG